MKRMDPVQLLPYTSTAVQCAVVPNLHDAVRCFATSHQQSQSSVLLRCSAEGSTNL